MRWFRVFRIAAFCPQKDKSDHIVLRRIGHYINTEANERVQLPV